MTGSAVAGASDRAAQFEALARAGNEEEEREVQARALARSFQPGEFGIAVEQSVRIPLYYRRAYLSALAAHWASSDPKAALEFASGLEDAGMRSEAIRAALEEWLDRRQEEALKWIHDETPGKAGPYTSVVIEVMQKRNPVRTLAFLNSLSTTGGLWESKKSFFENWVRSDVQAASKAAFELAPGDDRELSMKYVAAEWAKINPEAALAWIDQIPEYHVREQVRSDALTAWGSRDPMPAILWSEQMKDPGYRYSVQALLWRQWFGRDPKEATLMLVALPPSEIRTRGLKLSAQFRVRQDIPASLDLVNRLPEEDQIEALLNVIQELRSGVIQGDRAACELAMHLPPNGDRMAAVGDFCEKWAKSSPVEAAEWIQKNGTPAEICFVLPKISGAWARNDPEKALNWTNGLSDKQTRIEAIQRIVTSTSEREPRRAAEIYLNELQANERGNAGWILASNWIGRDAKAAARWAEMLPEDANRDQLLGTVAGSWYYRDFEAAATWVKRLSPGTGRDAALIGLSHVMARKDPEGSISFASMIGDSSKREKQLTTLACNWLRGDSFAAKRWIAETPQLSPEMKTELLSGNKVSDHSK
jgi:hypothetical protein